MHSKGGLGGIPTLYTLKWFTNCYQIDYLYWGLSWAKHRSRGVWLWESPAIPPIYLSIGHGIREESFMEMYTHLKNPIKLSRVWRKNREISGLDLFIFVYFLWPPRLSTDHYSGTSILYISGVHLILAEQVYAVQGLPSLICTTTLLLVPSIAFKSKWWK